jgi:mono/diheme cytochrome c family protein
VRELIKEVPRWLKYAVVVLLVLSWVPLVFIARARTTTSRRPRLHVVFDMDNQPKIRTQSANPIFADLRGMRPPVPGTVPHTEGRKDPEYLTGKTADGGWVKVMPVPMTMALMKRGQDRFDIYCEPCHGASGYGDGIVAKRAEALQEGTWTPPSSYHTDLVRSRPDGHIFNTITNGIRKMPAYGPQIPVADRWAIVAYVRALQRSQHASIDDVPPDLRSQLR